MLPPFPVQNVSRNPYRLLDTYGLPNMPGDVSRFGGHHIRTDAGTTLQGVWRPINGTRDATIAVERGCLAISHAALAAPCVEGAAAAMQVVGDLDVILTLLVEPPRQFPSGNDESFWVGAFVGVETSARGYCIACVDSDVAGTTASNQFDTLVTTFPLNLSLAGLPFTPDAGVRVTQWSSEQPLFVRLKRIGGSIRAYSSPDGFTWRESSTGSNRETGLSATAPAVIGVIVNAQMATPAGSIKAMVPEIKFLDPTTSFPS